MPRMADQVPYPWEAHFNEQYQTVFYFNTETGESTWEFPTESPVEHLQGEVDEDQDYEDGNGDEGDLDDEGEEEYIRQALGEFEVDVDEQDDENEVGDSRDYEPLQQEENLDRSVGIAKPGVPPQRSVKSMIPQQTRTVAPARQGLTVVERSNLMLQKKRDKEHAIRAEREQRELQEIHDPLINKSSKSINRSVEHMLSWDEQRKQKIQEQAISRQFEEERVVTGRPAITRKAVEVGIRRQQEDMRLQNQLLFGEGGDAADGNDDLGSIASGHSASQSTYVSGSTSVASRPVEDRLLEYEERKRLKLQRAVEQKNRSIKAAAAPMITHYADAVSVGREGDVVDRLYYGRGEAGGAAGGGGVGPSRAMQHDELTGQKLFQVSIFG